MSREFVAYDAEGNVVHSRPAHRFEPLESFAAEYPQNDVAEATNNRETRTIAKADAQS